jgi:hypothetical protein
MMTATKITQIADLRVSCGESTQNVQCTTWFGQPDEFGGTDWITKQFHLENIEWCCVVITPVLMWGDPSDVRDEIVAALKDHAKSLNLNA